ncbi:MAG: class I SAM-dependent methyltransferase [Planctomycetota bacterium]|nr:MAG: class I SAM-dependent methyltransferase [Planctomycetota bacterium]
MIAFYRRSALYSAFFAPSPEIRTAIDRLLRLHLRRKPRRVLDPACGPGLWLSHFFDQGSEVAGSDLEELAVKLASARLPARGAMVMVGDMRRPPDELGTDFDCAINLDNSVGHLPAYEDVVEHFKSMRQRLTNKGIYLIGLAIREPNDKIQTGVVYERGPVDIEGGGFAALRTESLGLQPQTRCERIRQIAITANVPDAPAVIAEQYDLLTFTFAMLRDILAAAGGFDVLGCYDATDEALPAKPFRKSAGDVVLVLRASAARTVSQRGARSVVKSSVKSAVKTAAKSASKASKKSAAKPAAKKGTTASPQGASTRKRNPR